MATNRHEESKEQTLQTITLPSSAQISDSCRPVEEQEVFDDVTTNDGLSEYCNEDSEMEPAGKFIDDIWMEYQFQQSILEFTSNFP